MLGSAIPKRWVVSLALVGLVSLFMASYAAVWASPASATTTTTTTSTSTPTPTPTNTPTPVPTGSVLSDLLAVSAINVSTGQVVGLSVSPVDDNGNVNLGMPAVTYSWNVSSGCGSLDSSTSRTPTFTATSSSCTGSIIVHANQGSGPNIPSSGRTISVNVVAPPPPPAPTAVPVDPAVVPTIVVAGAENLEVILPSTGGVVSVPSEGDAAPIELNILSSSLDDGTAAAVDIVVISSEDAPAPPAAATEGATSGTFRFGSTVIEINWYDDAGNALDTFSLNRPAEICFPFTQDDLNNASGGTEGMSIWRYNGTNWVELNSSTSVSGGTVCASTSNFSLFALGLAVAPPDAPAAGTGLPATGDYTPGVGNLILAMLAGFALVGTGVFTARRARKARQTS